MLTDEQKLALLQQFMTDDSGDNLASMGHYPNPYVCWVKGYRYAALDGEFTADELEAIAWWMRKFPVVVQ